MYSSDEESEEECGMVQALPVSSFTEFDASKPPETGMDYLRRVQLEASRCADVVVANVYPVKQAAHQTNHFENDNGFVACPENWKPNIEWQKQKVADFTETRFKISGIRNKIELSTFSLSRNEKWTNFFSELEDLNAKHIDQQISFFESHLPLLGIVLQFSQQEIHRLLIKQLKWMDHAGYSYQRGLWIYSLLACLQKPLPCDIYSTLRDISRSCSHHRLNQVSEVTDSKQINSLNVIICLIGHYFNQLDLLDE